MYSETDFHSLSEEEKSQLVNRRQVASSSGLLKDVPPEGTAVRIYEKPIEELLLDRLELGRFTISDLAEEFGVTDEDVRRIINKYRRRGRDSFTSESFKYNLLTDRNGSIRVKGVDGRAFEYTLETIPFVARIIDPTLTVSLLGIRDHLEEFPTIVNHVPPGRATEIDETYAMLLGDFWGIDPQDIFDEITEYDRAFVETAILPLPLIDSEAEYQKVRDRFRQSEAVYKRYRNLEQTANDIVNEFVGIVQRGQPGVRMYQVVSIELADLKRAARLQSPELVSTIDRQINKIVSTLAPEQEPTRGEERTDDAPVKTEEAVLSALDEDWSTAEDVFEVLPVVVQVETDLDEVRRVLDRLSGLGIISKRMNGQVPEFTSESSSVSQRDVL